MSHVREGGCVADGSGFDPDIAEWFKQRALDHSFLGLGGVSAAAEGAARQAAADLRTLLTIGQDAATAEANRDVIH